MGAGEGVFPRGCGESGTGLGHGGLGASCAGDAGGEWRSGES